MIPGIFTSGPDKALDLSQKRGETEKVIEELVGDWLMALKSYEEAKTGQAERSELKESFFKRAFTLQYSTE